MTTGIDITQAELEKMQLLEEIGCLDIESALNLRFYPSDRVEARKKFEERFAFFDMIKLGEIRKIWVMWQQMMDFCVDPRLLLDYRLYPEDLALARNQFKHRLDYYECFQGPVGVYGGEGDGKDCFAAVWAKRCRDWWGKQVVTFNFKLPESFGPSVYINEEDFIDELIKLNDIVEGTYGDSQSWLDSKGREICKLHNAVLIIGEAREVVGRGTPIRTRLGQAIAGFLRKWRHYETMTMMLTQNMRDLDPIDVVDRCTMDILVSRNFSMDRTTDVSIYHRKLRMVKPTIHLFRPSYYHLWNHRAPIRGGANITKSVSDKLKIRKKEV